MKQWLTVRWPFSIEAGVNRAYAGSLARHGPSPQGVFWNSAKSQTSRFAALLAAIRRHRAATGDNPVPPVIADIGCGYGAILDYLSTHEAYTGWRYLGLDINPAMIRACHERFPGRRASFRVGGMPPEPSTTRFSPHLQPVHDRRRRKMAGVYPGQSATLPAGLPVRHGCEFAVPAPDDDQQQHILCRPRGYPRPTTQPDRPRRGVRYAWPAA